MLLLELQTPDRLHLPPLRCRVVRASMTSENRWIIGCQFLSPLNEEELDAFLLHS